VPEELPKETRAETRKLAAIMFTDMVGFSRQVGANEARALRVLDTHNAVVQHTVATYQGQVLRFIGDAFLIEFPSVVNAVQCAQQLQRQFRVHNAETEKDEQIHVRIGIHLGDIIKRDSDVFGDGANIAARLQALAEPDTICLSRKVYEEVEKKITLGPVVSLGKPRLKNIAQRFQVYVLLSEPPKGLRQTLQVQRLKVAHRVGRGVSVFVLVSVLLLGGFVTLWSLFPSVFRIPYSAFSTQEAQPPALPLPDKPSIVVLPFVNMSGDPGQDYFSDGITEELTASLSRLSNLFVISRNTAFFYKGKAVKLPDLSRELGVQYVLEGSVRKADGQVRITTQLIDATTDHHLWSERYDRPLTDIFTLQDEIVQKIVTTLKLQLSLWEQGILVRKTTDNLEAYDYLLRGIEFYERNTKEAVAQARQLFEKAIELDPQYANAYVFLGVTYYREWALRWSTDPQTLERMFTLVQQAITLDDSLPFAHSLLGMVYAQKRQYEQALAESERALALGPNNADSYMRQAHILNWAGRPEEAIQMMEQAMRLNPRYSPTYLYQLAWAYLSSGRYTEAIPTLKEFLSRSPHLVAAHLDLAVCYLLQWVFQLISDPQTLAQAEAAVHQALALYDTSPWGHSLLGVIYLFQKQYEQALAEMERAVALDPNLADGYASLAQTLGFVGRSEETLQMIEQALRRKPWVADGHLHWIGSAYYLAGKPEEAIAPLQQYLSRYPNFLGAHLNLAAAYSELGKEAEARTEAAEVLRINPNFSLEVHRQRAPIKNPALLERHIAALRKAGLR
jgi:adenylate cyclase